MQFQVATVKNVKKKIDRTDDRSHLCKQMSNQSQTVVAVFVAVSGRRRDQNVHEYPMTESDQEGATEPRQMFSGVSPAELRNSGLNIGLSSTNSSSIHFLSMNPMCGLVEH